MRNLSGGLFFLFAFKALGKNLQTFCFLGLFYRKRCVIFEDFSNFFFFFKSKLLIRALCSILLSHKVLKDLLTVDFI